MVSGPIKEPFQTEQLTLNALEPRFWLKLIIYKAISGYVNWLVFLLLFLLVLTISLWEG